MRVLFVSCDPLEGAVTRYRCTHLAEALKSAGHTADVATIYDPVIRLEHDIVVLHRICANKEGQALADAVRKSGATLIYGADDLVWEAISPASSLGHPSSPSAPSSREEGLVSLHLAMLRQADGVLVSTDALAEFAKEAGAKDIAVVRNVANAMERPLVRVAGLTRKPGFQILYPSGTPTHDADLASIDLILANILNRFPQVILVLAGSVEIPVELKPYEERIDRLPLLAYELYLAVINQFPITIAPLIPNRFNRGKSEIKWQEAAICEKPVVASRWGGFAEVIHDGEDGFLADTPEEWEEKLSLLISDHALGYRLGSTARKRIAEWHDNAPTQISQTLERWVDSGLIHTITFSNPRGFAKGMVKKTLRRLKA